ncbi:YjbF family lipoprotein [Sulfitobacter sp. R18_1]|uniref:YjbF family lipoprotein n=1 Tax=Sulfitobacter sp. R18_1 TaxID=2821104 RepID=UPI001ADBDD63|nr:YjbF family lipoprotein [Sulfitobacter sp. R18_1]MBO9432180.1 YjbF family lipoprotein [Sulfitobacter sp. R18_1]
MKNKSIAVLSLLGFLSACGPGQSQQSLLGPITQTLFGFTKPASKPSSMEDIRRQVTPKVRQRFRHTSLIIAQLEQNERASILVRKGVNRDVETYYTPDNISLSLRDGVLISTRGLGFDLMSSDVAEVLTGLRHGGQAVRVHRYLDGEDQIVIKSYICDYSGNAQIIENCYGKDHSFKNSYQMSGGRVVASRQWIGPDLGYIRLEDV